MTNNMTGNIGNKEYICKWYQYEAVMFLGETKTRLRPEISSPVRENREGGKMKRMRKIRNRWYLRGGKVVEVRKGAPLVCLFYGWFHLQFTFKEHMGILGTIRNTDGGTVGGQKWAQKGIWWEMIKEMNTIHKQHLYFGKEPYRPLRRPYGGPNGPPLWPTVCYWSLHGAVSPCVLF